jgi:hypothetical protein
MLTQEDKENILKEFPNIKLSYETVVHKKVYNSDYIIAIPQGKKCFAWFTNINNKNVCLIMELINNKQINDIKITSAIFSNELAYGTILYGTVIYNSHNNFFFIEDIFTYKGNNIDRENWGEKLTKINTMFKTDLNQVSYNNNFIVFGLPLMSKTNEDLERKIDNLNYKIEKFHYKLFNTVNSYLFIDFINFIKSNEINNNPNAINIDNKIYNNNNNNNNNNKVFIKKDVVFLVRPDILDDIYYLYFLNNQEEEEQHSTAHIPNYDKSVMMNKLFRIIKENDNLDALEESDNEEEFENENIDKFVYLDKSYKMICQFNHKFKKWVPIKLAGEKNTVITSKELKIIYSNYDQNKKR